jgi:hypothetical protein
VLASIISFLLLVAACGGGDEAGDGGEAAAGSENDRVADEREEAGEGEEDTASENPWENYSSPIAALLGFDTGADPDDQEAEFLEQERQIQEQIRQCMAEQGWEYQPIDQSQFIAFGPGDDLSIEERALEYGYGFSTYFDEEEFFTGPEFEDPNQEYVESLSDAERDAYYRALYGDSPEIDPSLSEEEIEEIFENFVPTGCEPAAYEDAFGGGEQEIFYQTFDEQLQQMYERIESDPRIVAEQEAWSACMAEAGYPFSSHEDLYQELDRRMQPVWESQAFPGEDLSPEEIEAMSDEEREALFNRPPDVDEELLAEVQEYELALAAADLSCPGTTFLPSEARFEVMAEYEQAFIDENADQIREILPDADF